MSMGLNMGAVKKAIKYTVGIAVIGFAAYELSRMLKKKEETCQTSMSSFHAAPREPGDYRSIYNL
jgi:hypothetical protein